MPFNVSRSRGTGSRRHTVKDVNDSENDNRRVTLLALLGPTAVGKSAVAMRLAPEMYAEIISVDSMQVYRGMDIGTAKPGDAERARVRFHMLDVVDPTDSFSAAAFKEKATVAIDDVTARGKRPLLVGGSGLYFRAVVDDLDFAGSCGARPYRSGPVRELEVISDAELHRLLERLDPDAAGEIDASNRKRVLRAIEVARGGERLISERQASWKGYSSPYYLIAVGLDMDRSLLYSLIDLRVEQMMSIGLVQEVRRLRERGLGRGTTAGEALGYRQVLELLNGDIGRGEVVGEIKRKTRNLAKRQLTWFKKDPRIRWFRVEGHDGDSPQRVDESLARTAGLIVEYMVRKLEG